MTPETRKNILRYGIAIDLAIMATGVALLFPAAPLPALLAVFVAAVALSAWKGEWSGGVTAIVCSLLAFLFAFQPTPDIVTTSVFTAASLVLCGAGVALGKRMRQGKVVIAEPVVPVIPEEEGSSEVHAGEELDVPSNVFVFQPENVASVPVGETEAVVPTPTRTKAQKERAAREEAERQTRERKARESAEAEARESERRQQEEKRAAAEREARLVAEREARLAAERTAAERLAKEKHDAALLEEQRKQQEQVKQEAAKRAADQLAAAEKAAQELAAGIAAERAAAHREMEERLAAERAEATRRAEQERLAFERDLVARRDAEREADREVMERRLEEERTASRKAEEERLAQQRQVDAQREAEREAERVALDQRVKAERAAAEKKAEAERRLIQLELETKLAEEREARQRELEARRAAERELERQAAERKTHTEQLAEERLARQRELEGRRAAEQELARQTAERKAEAERLAAERKAEAARSAADREAEALRLAAAERKAEEERWASELAQEARLAAERAAAQLELERIAAEKRAAEQLESERMLQARLAAERDALRRKLEEQKEAQREAERLASEYAAAEKLEMERRAAERQEEARLAGEREEMHRRHDAEVAAESDALARQAAANREAKAAAAAAAEREVAQRVAAEREAAARAAKERDEAMKEAALVAAQAAAAAETASLAASTASVAPAAIVSAPVLSVPIVETLSAAPSAEDSALFSVTAVANEPAPSAAVQDVSTTWAGGSLGDGPSRPQTASELLDPLPPSRSRQPRGAQPEEKQGIVAAITGWFRKPQPQVNVNLTTKRVAGNTTATRRPASAATNKDAEAASARRSSRERNPRLLLLEKRRGTADTVVPKLKAKGLEIEVVERWIDAVDEIFRFRPDALFVDLDLPDFEKVYKSIAEHQNELPLFLTGRPAHALAVPPHVRYAGFVIRPYDADVLLDIAEQAVREPETLLAAQVASQTVRASASGGGARKSTATRSPVAATPAKSSMRIAAPLLPESDFEQQAAGLIAKYADAEPVFERQTPLEVPEHPPVPPPNESIVMRPLRDDGSYEVVCSNCGVDFDANDADWCSCLTKERTLVCTNCLTCFCKSAPSYKEKFWVEAPSGMMSAKISEGKKQQSGLLPNPLPEEVRRPLVLAVEDDEEIQVIVQRVCQNLGYGFVQAMNGLDGLAVARQYRPDLILADAFMPKLDGREMCRQLREEPGGAEMKMVVMTGLYTDTKYRSEAVRRFRVDDYVLKPVSITDLISILQRHLEGMPGPTSLGGPDMAAVSAAAVDPATAGVVAAVIRAQEADEWLSADVTGVVGWRDSMKVETYEVDCFSCAETFDAAHAEWCSDTGHEQTLLCDRCGNCFCKAPDRYKERFWLDAPPSLFERRMIGAKRNSIDRSNPPVMGIRRPLILLVEGDENIQLIVRTVVTALGFGFVVGVDGAEGLALAREYKPELILADAFMPNLDGRDMCRQLKEDPAMANTKTVVMTGLYGDRRYQKEALAYFGVEDYISKPLAVEDLVKLFKKQFPQHVQPSM